MKVGHGDTAVRSSVVDPFQLYSCKVLTELNFPERALVAHPLADLKPVTVCSFHIPPRAV
jgi:hypothetical protein